MINGEVEQMVVEGDIWVRMSDVIVAIDAIAENAVTLAEATDEPYMAIQAHGIAEVGEGLRKVLDRMRILNGLTPKA